MGRPAKYPGLKEAILYNETRQGEADFLSVEELAKKFGCKQTYIYRLRYLLGLKGGVTKPQSLSSIHTSSQLTDEGLLAELANEKLITPLERLKILSKIVRTGNPAIKIQALKTLEEMTRTSEGRLGPGAPLTREDKITRLARLLLALPIDVAAEAWETAYGYPPSTAPTRTPVQSDEAGTETPAPAVEGPLPNLPIPPNN